MTTKRCDCCGQALPEYGGIVADDERAEIRFRGKVVYPTGEEFALFRALLDKPGRVLTKEMLLDALYWDRRSDKEVPEIKIIDVYVCKLRKKLKPLGLEITTHWGRGYGLAEPKRSAAA